MSLFPPVPEKLRQPRHFKRGQGAFVSVMLPTRGRPQWFKESIASLWLSAKSPNDLELVVKVDEDDLESRAAVEEMAGMGVRTIMWCSPRGAGYQEIHLWYDVMADLATGDWLMLWNDDARMLLKDWDEQISLLDAGQLWHGVDEAVLLSLQVQDHHKNNEFVVVRKEAKSIFGHLSISPHCDNHLFTVFNMLGSAYRPLIFVQHLLDTEEARETRDDETEAGRLATPEFNCAPLVEGRLRDVVTLTNYLKKRMGEFQ